MLRTTASLALCLGLLGLGGAALAGSAETGQTEAAKQKTTDMPATKHQEKVLKGKVEGMTKVPPRGETAEDMPVTKHQQEVLDEEKTKLETTR